MEELAAIRAVANKAWGSQQNQKKQGDSKKGAGKPKDQQSEERPWWILVMDVEGQAISSESAPIPTRSL